VLEVKDSGYTTQFGHHLTECAVLDIDPSNRAATIVADLANGNGIPTEAFDCFILTQTLQYVFDLPAALATTWRVLVPGGILLATVPVISRVAGPPLTDYWRLTAAAMRRLLDDAFGVGAASVEGVGNVLAQVAFLEGLAAEDLTRGELAASDERFPLLVCARAVKNR
jgi:SAM-dependent methyltransferase